MKTIAKTQYRKGYWLVYTTDFMDGYQPEFMRTTNDIQVILYDDKDERLSDAVCHYGSYGVEDGLWEIMSDDLPKNWGDSVMGNLIWKEVERYFDKTIRRVSKEVSKPK